MPNKSKVLNEKIIYFSINTLSKKISGFRFLDAKNKKIKMDDIR